MSDDKKLKKNLTLFDVYAGSTGAMFSSGFFLLPGIAASYTGDSVYLAYLLAGFLIIPAMLCMAELSTAMPKAGGTYYFLDRALGPLFGTIGGLGSWIAVVNPSLREKQGIEVAMSADQVFDAVTNDVVTTTNGNITLDMYPCELRAFRVQ